MTKWGGRNRYFGRDRSLAVQRYAESIQEWAAWREAREAALRAPSPKSLTVIDLAERFVHAKRLEGGDDLDRYYRNHLKRFLVHFAGMQAKDVRVADLQSLKMTMLAPEGREPYAPKTINHDIVAIRAMMQWAMDQEMVPAVNLKGCRVLPLGPPPDKSLSFASVLFMVYGAMARRPDVAAWLAVQYLTAARPAEMPRVVHGQGSWVEDGVFRLDRGKMDLKTRSFRHVLFSPRARAWLARCEPVWSDLKAYSTAVRKVCGAGGPHALRHSAMTHLLVLGVERADADLILGHVPGRVSLTYGRIQWSTLLPKLSLLSL